MKKENKGFTITEIIIVTGLFSVLLAVTIGLYVQGNRRSTRLEARLEALQAAHLLRAHLADDFSSLIPVAGKRKAIKGASVLSLSRVKRERDLRHLWDLPGRKLSSLERTCRVPF